MNKAQFYAALRKRNSGVFGTSLRQTQVNGIEAILIASVGMPISYVAYCLATAYHETGARMQPIREANGSSDAQSIARLDAWARKTGRTRNIYWRPDDDGKAWFGRGLVQLTFKDNYRKAAALVGADLVGNPDLALDMETAAEILVEGCRVGLFTGKKLSDYLPGDYVGARRIVNGTDKASQVAGYARAFERALAAGGYSEIARVTGHTAPPAPVTPQPRPVEPESKPGPLLAILRALLGLFTRRPT